MRLDVVQIEEDGLSRVGDVIEPRERQRVDGVGTVLLLDRLRRLRRCGPQRAKFIEALREAESAREETVGEKRPARIPVVLEDFRHADLGVRKSGIELDHAMLRREPRGQHRGNGRIRPRALRIRLVEHVCAAGERIEERREPARAAVGSETVGAQGVDDDQEDVRERRGCPGAPHELSDGDDAEREKTPHGQSPVIAGPAARTPDTVPTTRSWRAPRSCPVPPSPPGRRA